MRALKVVVVGGGVVGLTCAHEIATRGHAVEVIDRGPTKASTSWAATGILPAARMDTATDPLDRLRGYSHALFPQTCQRIETESGIDVGFRKSGGYFLADSAGERAAMIGATEYWNDLKIHCESIALPELVLHEPHLQTWSQQTPNAAAWWVEDECQIRPPHFLKALRLACQRLGVRFRVASVTDVRQNESSGSVRCDNQWNDADQIVLCGGVWTGSITEKLRLDQSLIPIRGQILLMKHADRLFDSVINLGNRYLVCRDDGHVLVGSCEEEVGFTTGTTPETLDSLRQFAYKLCPKLTEAATIKGWSGFRPLTFDGFPMIGRVPDRPSLLVAAGHYRSGIHFSLGTAQIMADLVETKEPAIDIEPFRVGKQQDHHRLNL